LPPFSGLLGQQTSGFNVCRVAPHHFSSATAERHKWSSWILGCSSSSRLKYLQSAKLLILLWYAVGNYVKWYPVMMSVQLTFTLWASQSVICIYRIIVGPPLFNKYGLVTTFQTGLELDSNVLFRKWSVQGGQLRLFTSSSRSSFLGEFLK
jgi:hypothetical protein